ncbi:hypothetical protein HPB51_022168 [Rhipicephalus microplus]|uniref:Uncharacterized protein n=1 Tax=Rhipicephalus microplus TaxID=6941 RepID=A0A9J6E4R8_RHIMP|nr:hypothetical protein HPB51_022168 [Rhipicephalus microplus]
MSRTMKNDCPAKIVFAAKRGSQELEITCTVLDHNHETIDDMFASYPKCRCLNDNEAKLVQPLIEMKVRPTRIIQKLKEETGKVIIAKDVHNMRTNNNRGNDTEKLLQMISDLCEKEQATVIPITDESQELQLLFASNTSNAQNV